MTTEMSSTLTAAGLGMSTAVSIGGDAIIGSSYAELMPLFEADEQTQAIVIYTEPGGRMEAELARWVTENNSRLPIVAFMAGRFMDEMPGHELRPRRHDRRGQGGHRHREDRPPGRGRNHRGRARSRTSRICQGEDRSAHARHCSSTSRSTPPPAPTPSWPASWPRSARSTSSRPATTGVEIVEDNLDECVLCELCINAAPAGAIRVLKLYSGETLPAG